MRLFAFSILLAVSHCQTFKDCTITPKELSKPHRISGKVNSHNLDFFHSSGLPYSPIYAFTDVFLQINLTDPDSYQFYKGENCSIVQELYENDNKYFGLLKRAAILRSHQLNIFNDTIVGVATSEPYEISVVIWKINIIRIIAFIGAILLFVLAGSLVRNALFYYTSGCSFGLLASLLLVAFIVWRVAPKKTIGVPILIGGWSVSLYMLHFAWSNLQGIMLEYQKYVIGYFVSVLLISLAYCYKKGPPTDERSHDIAQWTLQLVALLIIYVSPQIVEVAIGTIFVLLLQQVTRGFLFSGIRWYFVGLRAFWRKMFPQARRLLTEEEYEEQGRKTTEEELARLREYCRKEGNRPWKLAGKVRNARRLANFIEGDDGHVTEEETFAHDITGDVLDRGDDEEFYNGTPLRQAYEDEDDEEWDEIFVRRGSSRNAGPSSVHSVRVPRRISSKLLSPYDSFNLNHTFNVARSVEPSSNHRSAIHNQRFASDISDQRYRGAMSEMRPNRRAQQQEQQSLRRKFDEKELIEFRAQMLERRQRNMEEEEKRWNGPPDLSRPSTSSSSVDHVVPKGQKSKKNNRIPNKRSPRRNLYRASDSEGSDGF